MVSDKFLKAINKLNDKEFEKYYKKYLRVIKATGETVPNILYVILKEYMKYIELDILHFLSTDDVTILENIFQNLKSLSNIVDRLEMLEKISNKEINGVKIGKAIFKSIQIQTEKD
ncbi:MAG: hypothetical protein ACTSWR_06015 [Candidatus Helarchaeota archaeon]